MSVAELGVGGGWALVLTWTVRPERIVLLGDMLCEIWRDQLLHLLGFVGLSFFSVIHAAVQVSRPLREPLVVVAMHQGSVRVCGCGGGEVVRRRDSGAP